MERLSQNISSVLLESDRAVHSVGRLLLSHHPPEHIHRTVVLAWGRHRARVCSRCFGLVVGLLTVLLLVPAGNLPAWDRWFGAWLVLLCPIPAIVDFHGQLMGSWESTNLRRLLTGIILGAGVALSIWKVSAGNWLCATVIPCVIGLYFAWVVLNGRRFARMLRHLRMYAGYYERCRTEDARRAVRKMLTK